MALWEDESVILALLMAIQQVEISTSHVQLAMAFQFPNSNVLDTTPTRPAGRHTRYLPSGYSFAYLSIPPHRRSHACADRVPGSIFLLERELYQDQSIKPATMRPRKTRSNITHNGILSITGKWKLAEYGCQWAVWRELLCLLLISTEAMLTQMLEKGNVP